MKKISLICITQYIFQTIAFIFQKNRKAFSEYILRKNQLERIDNSLQNEQNCVFLRHIKSNQTIKLTVLLINIINKYDSRPNRLVYL